MPLLHRRTTSAQNRSSGNRRAAWLVLVLFAGWLAGCSTPAFATGPKESLTPTPNFAYTQAFQKALEMATRLIPTATPTITPTVPTATPTVTPTPLRTPSPLPPVFKSWVLDKDVIPVEYVADRCEYLKNRWDPNNSAPGTVVMTIMYHSVTKDYKSLLPDGSQVHHSDLIMALDHAHEVGFQTITAAQLADFLERNAPIPRRSLLIIVDDRKRKEYYETHFIPRLKEYGWTITNAWISANDTPDYLWKENEEVVKAGWVDVQAHGVIHNINIGEYSTDEFIHTELYGSIEAIVKHYGKAPIAFIWPGGGFSKKAAAMANEAGYRVGFTTNPRGPVMYNWVPQAEKEDPNHPNWLPEIPAANPLMTLPRYWSIDAAYRIDDVITIGDDAAAEAAKNKASELVYYDVMCKSRTGEIPTKIP
jgi:hypothetical protein